MKVVPAPPEHFPWLTARTSWVPTAGLMAIEAVDADGHIRGMVGYDCWTKNSVQMHVALASPAACRPLLRPAFWCPFVTAGLGVVLGIIPADNADSLKFALRTGFKVSHRVADGWAKGVDLVHLELRREDCRYLQPHAKAA